ncbi:MAG: hypothetical protein JSW50_09665 [Candidatus Latescibacterota bacterium]|nr:MAG: hypothetical protein JSW50_09665 [Candidatus Latescibacterota bacterium]
MATNSYRIFACLLAVVIAAPTLSAAGRIMIEAESFTAHNDTGGQLLQSIALSGCSGGYALIGLDADGEWATYDVSVAEFGYYSFLIKCRGEFNVAYNFQLVFTPVESGEAQTVDFEFVGMGYG